MKACKNDVMGTDPNLVTRELRCMDCDIHECNIRTAAYGPLYKSSGSGKQSYQVGGGHYLKEIQPWDVMKVWMSKEEFEGFLRGNVIKYILRFREKNGVEDLRKAKHYLEKLIEEQL